MTRYFASSSKTRRNRPLSTGFDTLEEASAQAEFLADTYGGVAKVFDQEKFIGSYSTSGGWRY